MATADGSVHVLDAHSGAIRFHVASSGSLASASQDESSLHGMGGAIVPTLSGDVLLAEAQTGTLSHFGLSIKDIMTLATQGPFLDNSGAVLHGTLHNFKLGVDYDTGEPLCHVSGGSSTNPITGAPRCSTSGRRVLWLAHTRYSVYATANAHHGEADDTHSVWNANHTAITPAIMDPVHGYASRCGMCVVVCAR